MGKPSVPNGTDVSSRERLDFGTLLERPRQHYGTTRHTTNTWCLLAAVLAHEAAHTALRTERQALMAEAAQLRRCLFAGHLSSGDGWSPVTYLDKVEAKLRHPREHY